ncbi:MAG TPA: hypothetical protein VFT20_08905 [Candidatus Limnocylindrales bacterium]|nr:hypothetical protein [Candidatus Limnocylindrales bacterium]
MTTPNMPSRLIASIRLSPLDIVIARHAHAHGHGEHVAPTLGCYLCLHGVRTEGAAVRELRLAA